MEKSYKYRIYPNKEQQEIIQKTFGSCRFVYNYYLDKKIDLYKTSKTNFTYNQCCNDLTQLKKEYEWLKEVESTTLQSSLKDLDMAYQKFFKEQTEFPKFKSKKTHRFSYMIKNNSFDKNRKTHKIEYYNKYIKLPFQA